VAIYIFVFLIKEVCQAAIRTSDFSAISQPGALRIVTCTKEIYEAY